MQIELRRKPRSHTATRVLLWTLVLAAFGLFYLRANPWQIAIDPQLSDGNEISREAQADIIIVIDYDAMRKQGGDFERHDWSAAWINTIEQEVGPVTIATPRSLSHKVLGESRIVILTSSVSAQIPDALMARLREHVEAGNLLVVERPGGALREAWAADGRAGERRGQQFTFAKDLPEPYQTQMREIPLSTDYIGSTRARKGSEMMLSIDGAPVVYANPVGEGHVVTVDFDYGEALTALQQGKPNKPGFGVAPTGAKKTEHDTPRPSDLMMSQKLVGAPVPYADLLERFMVHGVLMRYAPGPTLWTFPNGREGAVIAIHQDEQLGDGGAWMLDHELERKGVSSLLTTIDAGLSASGAATIHRKGGDIGLLWRMQGTPSELLEPMGVAGFEPLTRPTSLKQQTAELRQTLPVSYVRTCRVAGGWWSKQWDEPFRQMAKENLRIDMSYELPRTSGFAFGTGFPFLAVRDTGTPLGVRELPVVVPDRAVEGPSINELLDSSQKGHHMAITYAVEPAGFADYPDMERFGAWLDLFDEIERTNHIMTSPYRYDNFMRTRRASNMRSRVIAGVDAPKPGFKIPTLDAKDKDGDKPDPAPPASSSKKRATLLRITIEAKAKGMSLTVPARMGDGTGNTHTFSSARQRSQRLGKEGSSAELEARHLSLIGIDLVLVPLERGFNTIDIYYTNQ